MASDKAQQQTFLKHEYVYVLASTEKNLSDYSKLFLVGEIVQDRHHQYLSESRTTSAISIEILLFPATNNYLLPMESQIAVLEKKIQLHIQIRNFRYSWGEVFINC